MVQTTAMCITYRRRLMSRRACAIKASAWLQHLRYHLCAEHSCEAACARLGRRLGKNLEGMEVHRDVAHLAGCMSSFLAELLDLASCSRPITPL